MPGTARWRALVAVVLVTLATAVAVPACTSSSWDTSDIDDTTPTTVKEYPDTEAGFTDSLADHLSRVGSDLGQWAAPADEAACAAKRLVRRLTVDRLRELGYDRQAPTLALAWTEEERAAVVNVLSGCIDVSASILETYSSYNKLPLAQSNCMAKGFERLGLTRDLVSSLVDGAEVDPFANSDRFASGLASLAVECMGEDDLLPNAPMPKLPPSDGALSTTTTTTIPLGGLDADEPLEGIEPGGPLDTTTTEP